MPQAILNSYLAASVPEPPTPEFWLRSDEGVTLGGSPAVNGGLVDTWEDRTGNGWDATQPTMAQQPTYNTSVLNGFPALNFPAATNQLMIIPSANSITPAVEVGLSWFAVLRPTDFAAAGVLLQKNGSGIVQWYLPTSGKQIFSNGTESTPSTTALTAAAWNRVGMRVNWSVGPANYYLDGVIDGTEATGVTGSGSGADLYIMGNPPPFVFPFKGDIVELLYYTRIVTPTEAATIDAYFVARYGL